MPSGLLLNLLGNLHMYLWTSSGDRIISDSSASIRLSISGRVPSSSVNTEENCALRISAFSLLLTVISPKLSSRGATPFLHTRLWFTYLYNFEESPDSRIFVSLWLMHFWMASMSWFCAVRQIRMQFRNEISANRTLNGLRTRKPNYLSRVLNFHCNPNLIQEIH